MRPDVRVNGEKTEVADADLVVLSPGHYSVVLDGRVYEVRADGDHMVVNGRRVLVEIDDPRQFQQGAKRGSSGGRAVLRSTMPGKVVRLLVSAGDTVEAGQGVLIIEAMKMQNEVKSPRAGTVTQLKVKADETVAAGAELAVID